MVRAKELADKHAYKNPGNVLNATSDEISIIVHVFKKMANTSGPLTRSELDEINNLLEDYENLADVVKTMLDELGKESTCSID